MQYKHNRSYHLEVMGTLLFPHVILYKQEELLMSLPLFGSPAFCGDTNERQMSCCTHSLIVLHSHLSLIWLVQKGGYECPPA